MRELNVKEQQYDKNKEEAESLRKERGAVTQ